MYRKIDTRIWCDEKFLSMTHLGRYCFIYLLTHPSMTSLGAMRGTIKGLSIELSSDGKAFGEALPEAFPEAFGKAFGEALSKGILKADSKACFIGIPNFIKYNRPESPNVITGWKKIIGIIPECELQRQHIQRVMETVEGLGEAYAKAFREAFPEAYAKGFAKAMANQEQEQEQEQDKTPIPPLPKKQKPEIVFPTELDTPGFREAWGNWERFRKEKRNPLPESTVKAQLTKLAKMGEPAAIASIQQSIENGWTGLFEPKGNANGNARKNSHRDGEYPENLQLAVWDATKEA